jgi:hypothetical protein
LFQARQATNSCTSAMLGRQSVNKLKKSEKSTFSGMVRGDSG